MFTSSSFSALPPEFIQYNDTVRDPFAVCTMSAVTLPPDFDEPALSGARRLDEAVSRGQSRVFRVLWFWVPSGSVARDSRFQQLLASRFLTDIALQVLLYGALIATAKEAGRGSVDAALLGSAYLLPGVLLGMIGGIVADALPKRIALIFAYFLMGAIALAVPFFFGTSFRSMLGVLFGVRVLHQVSQPSEASAVPLVANQEELATATSFLGLASSVGEVIGKAVLAPIIVRASGSVDAVTVLAGVLFIFSGTRLFDLRTGPRPRSLEGAVSLSTRQVLRWLLGQRTMMWMLLLGALASTSGVVLGVLAPQYTREVLDVDPEFALYVFAPAVLGLIAGLAITPLAVKIVGERAVTMFGFLVLATTMSSLGLVHTLDQRMTGLWVIDLPGVSSRPLEIAAQLSVFLGFSMTLSATAVQIYIARNVPLAIQGRTFALLGAMKDGLAIVALLAIGATADVFGVARVITVSPLLLLALAWAFVRYTGRWRRQPPAGEGDEAASADTSPA